jgi:hypothetical protein
MSRVLTIASLAFLLVACDSSGGMDNVIEDCPLRAERLTFGSHDSYRTVEVDIVVDTSEAIQFPELRGDEQQDVEFTLTGEKGRFVFRGDLCCASYFLDPYDPGEDIDYWEIYPHLTFPEGGGEGDLYGADQIEITNEVKCEVL